MIPRMGREPGVQAQPFFSISCGSWVAGVIGMSFCVSLFEFLKFFIFLERALANEANR